MLQRKPRSWAFRPIWRANAPIAKAPVASRHQAYYVLMMRTTLTLDEDVAAQIERLRRDRDSSLKDVVNEALRLGLREMRAPRQERQSFRTEDHAMGATRISIDNVAEALAHGEGESFR
jgi:Arc/MetJ-type ribon-helix-helix transcriptional regulator